MLRLFSSLCIRKRGAACEYDQRGGDNGTRAGRQADRQTDGLTDTQADRHANKSQAAESIVCYSCNVF